MEPKLYVLTFGAWEMAVRVVVVYSTLENWNLNCGKVLKYGKDI